MSENQEEPKEQKTSLQKILKYFPLLSVIGLVLGAIGGYLYYFYVGCESGTCSITSSPWKSTLWGALMGYLLFDMFKRRPKEKKES